MNTTTLDSIRAAFDALACVSADALCVFCDGRVPSDLDEASAEVLGRLDYLPGRHPGVSVDAPEVLVNSPLGRLVVGYDERGHGLAVPYAVDLDIRASIG